MSKRDIDFVSNLSVTNSDIAKALAVSRQAVSRGLSKEHDYFDAEKLTTLGKILPERYDIDTRLISELIERFYPSTNSDLSELIAASELDISLEGTIYVICNKFLSYYRLRGAEDNFSMLRAFMKNGAVEGSVSKIVFAFSDASSKNYATASLISWLDDDKLLSISKTFVCDVIAVLPFAVCGKKGVSHSVYFFEDNKFKQIGRNNSRYIVKYIEQVVANRIGLVRELQPR
ncbi:hypothetical protein [Aquibium sp. ELW1220]|uniref:hypothetical protein n=1 Tax=Aquibium sp. ELW1220 TaxID=2976766 RepID=UPI0025B0D671|nr:hypothetical protein [Aquibium sp. ELW1220]MDN2578751.1 hypothetical protein [Aquibium sp. ELW1220]